MNAASLLRLTLTLVVVTSVLLAVGCNQPDAPPQNNSVATPPPTPPGSSGSDVGGRSAVPPAEAPIPKADFELAAADLAQEVKSDREAASAKYKDKWIKITGLRARDTVGADKALPVGPVTWSDISDANVSCTFAPDDYRKLMDQSVATQELTVVGKFVVPELSRAELSECRLVAMGEDPTQATTAAEVSKALVDDPDAAVKKYEHKPFDVGGRDQGNGVRHLGLRAHGWPRRNCADHRDSGQLRRQGVSRL
jgi:hypothetical protein